MHDDRQDLQFNFTISFQRTVKRFETLSEGKQIEFLRSSPTNVETQTLQAESRLEDNEK